jgi:hypothetical protein
MIICENPFAIFYSIHIITGPRARIIWSHLISIWIAQTICTGLAYNSNLIHFIYASVGIWVRGCLIYLTTGHK